MRLLHRPLLHLLRIQPSTLIAPTIQTALNPYTPPTQHRTMSDDAYAAFLAKSNRDYSAGVPSSPPKTSTLAMPKHPKLAAFNKKERVYVSDSDEPFEPVKIEWEGGEMPSGGM